MNTAIILSGGVGTRMGENKPKQYLMAGGKPVFLYAVETFCRHASIDLLVMVLAEEWRPFVSLWLGKSEIRQKIIYAPAGDSRQHSIYNGLVALEGILSATDVVVIHDAARPLVSVRLISDCLENIKEADGVMPVIAVKDTIYLSHSGKSVDGLLNRDELFAGQAPECFVYGKYYAIHQGISLEELHQVRGTTEIAFKKGLQVKLIPGEESNFKITTPEDLQMFNRILNKQGEV